MNIWTRRKMVAVLRILRDAQGPLGSERISESLRLSGIELSERTVRNYLAHTDELGLTTNLGRRGRELTESGLGELEKALGVDKVGFVSARVDTLTCQMDFDVEAGEGQVILNVSTLLPKDVRPAIRELTRVYNAGLGMGRLVTIAAPEERIGSFRVPKRRFALGTICSVSLSGILLHARIPTTSCFGGLLQYEDGQPKRFTEIVHYDGSSLNPQEIFIRGRMTSVSEACREGSGLLGAGFREVPAIALPQVKRLCKLSEKLGIGGAIAVGTPGHPLLDVAVPQGRVGLITASGLNPIAAIGEMGISVESEATSTLCDFKHLIDYRELKSAILKLRLETYY